MSASKSKSQVESDLDLARERLSFYEQFDEIIKQNIASSSALLKEASARLDSDIATERNRYRALLSGILDDLSALQAQSEKIARRVTDALDELEGNASPSEKRGAPEAASAGFVAEAPPEAAAVVNAAAGASRKLAEKPKTAEVVAVEAASTAAGAPSAASAAVTAPISNGSSRSATTTLLVHGVPRASAALALKSYIEKLDFVSTVEPREFAAGLLRLQVDGARPLGLGDLSGWNMADRIQLRSAGNDLLEVDLAPA
jgi:hypothetical protein